MHSKKETRALLAQYLQRYLTKILIQPEIRTFSSANKIKKRLNLDKNLLFYVNQDLKSSDKKKRLSINLTKVGHAFPKNFDARSQKGLDVTFTPNTLIFKKKTLNVSLLNTILKISEFHSKQENAGKRRKILANIYNIYSFFGKQIPLKSKIVYLLLFNFRPYTSIDFYQTYTIFKDLHYICIYLKKDKVYNTYIKSYNFILAFSVRFYLVLKKQLKHPLYCNCSVCSFVNLIKDRTLNAKIYYFFYIKPFGCNIKKDCSVSLVHSGFPLVPSVQFKLIRPLFFITRLDTFYLCESLKLPIYPDKSNSQVKFLRNRIRKQILPAIRILLNPQFDTIVCNFSQSFLPSRWVYVD